MARPLEQGDRIGVRLKPEARRMLETAAASLGVSKSQLVRADDARQNCLDVS